MDLLFTDLPLTRFVPLRYRPGNLGTWSGHLAFANDLIVATQPSLIVELGTHWGESYFTFCQSILENSLNTRAFAVDHWRGEAHAGFYDEAVFENVRAYNSKYYQRFSSLLRMSFEEATAHFSPASVDLLHIDGCHTYAAVSHDFKTWLPFVKPGGIILFHDTNVREGDFGVWRFWNEIKRDFTDTFEFQHCWGLGVLRKPGAGLEYPGLLGLLFRGSPAVHQRLRDHYFVYASYLETLLRAEQRVATQVYPFGEAGYTEATAQTQVLQESPGELETIHFSLPHGLGAGPVRIDPSNCPSVIELQSVSIKDATSNTLLWEAKNPAEVFRAVTISGSAVRHSAGNGAPLLISLGPDPQILLPNIQSLASPISVTLALRVDSLHDHIFREVNLALLSAEAASQQMKQALAERDTIIANLSAERDRETSHLRREISARDQEAQNLKHQIDALQSDLLRERQCRLAISQSASWRLTEPFRRVAHLLRGRP